MLSSEGGNPSFRRLMQRRLGRWFKFEVLCEETVSLLEVYHELWPCVVTTIRGVSDWIHDGVAKGLLKEHEANLVLIHLNDHWA